jgi:hypothetical protein
LHDRDPSPTSEPPPEKKVAGETSTETKAPKRLPLRLVPERTPPPQGDDRRRLIDELTAWAQEHAPGVNAIRLLDLWLLNCAAKHYEFPDWFGEGTTQLRTAYYDAQERQAALEQKRAADEARMQVFMAEKQAEEDARFPGGREAWEDIHDLYGTHVVCGWPHQYNAPCPPRRVQATPAAAD